MNNANFGKGSGPILIRDVQCSSPKQSLLECNIYYHYNPQRTHNNDVGVICQCNSSMSLKCYNY